MLLRVQCSTIHRQFSLAVLTACTVLSVCFFAVGCSSKDGTDAKAGGATKDGGVAKGGTKGHVNMTFAEFRKAVFNDGPNTGRWEPKKSFFDKFGEPLQVKDVGADTHLTYQCKDGRALIKVARDTYHTQDAIITIDVDQQ